MSIDMRPEEVLAAANRFAAIDGDLDAEADLGWMAVVTEALPGGTSAQRWPAARDGIADAFSAYRRDADTLRTNLIRDAQLYRETEDQVRRDINSRHP